ncbi:hypothetical protein ACFL1A_00195 [Patescibacteria group bacterium]
MIITFCGPSGSGKSYALKITAESLRQQDYSIHKEDDFLILKLFKFLGAGKSIKRYHHHKMSGGGKKASRIVSLAVVWIYPLIILLEYFWLYIWYEVFFYRKKIILSDRFTYDYAVTLRTHYGKDNYLTRMLEGFFYPSWIVYCSTDIKTLIKRNKNKSEFPVTGSVKFLKNIKNQYDQILRKKPHFAINTSEDRQMDMNKFKNISRFIISILTLGKIAFCGVDGSGKSTVSRKIAAKLSKFGIKTRVVHFYQEPFLMRIAFLNKQIKKIGKINVGLEKRSFLWALAYWLDACLQYIYYNLRYPKTILVFDRFFQDYLVSFRYYKVSFIKLFEKATPLGVKVFLISIDYKVAWKRKKEKSINHTKDLDRIYEDYISRLKFVKVCASNKNPKKLTEEIIYILLT